MLARRLTLAVVALAALAPSAHAGEPAQAAKRSCGTISSTSIYPYVRVIAIRGVSCRRARRVARAYDRSGDSPGRWRCFLAHMDRPRLFSCGYPPRRGDIRKARHAVEAIGTRRR